MLLRSINGWGNVRCLCLCARHYKEKRVRKVYEGEELEVHLKRKRERIANYLNYLGQVYYVVDRFTEDIAKEAQARKDVEGEQYKRVEMERKAREEALLLIAKDNEERARNRALRMEREREEQKKYYEEKNLEKLQAELDDVERKRLIVLKAIEESKEWITPENLEEKINEALDAEVNYNFALSPTGEKIYSTRPPGNFGPDWKSPGPSAFVLGGFKADEGEWDLVFRRYERANAVSKDDEDAKKDSAETS